MTVTTHGDLQDMDNLFGLLLDGRSGICVSVDKGHATTNSGAQFSFQYNTTNGEYEVVAK